MALIILDSVQEILRYYGTERTRYHGANVPTGTLYVQSVPVGTLERFYRNTVENSENSESHLKAIVHRRQVAARDGLRAAAGKVAEKPQGEEKARESGFDSGSRQRRALIT
jgi:hypothetical protein